MNTTELIEIARECCFSRQVVDGETVLITFRSQQLQQFAQRIQQPLLNQVENQRLNCEVAYRYAFYIRDISIQRDVLIAELEAFAVNRNARIAELEQELHYATQAARFEADMCEQAMADMKQLREALEKIADLDGNWGPFPETNKHWCAMAVVTARETLKEMEQTK